MLDPWVDQPAAANLGLSPGSRVLDVGCGTGRFLTAARLAGHSVVGTELSPTAAQIARERALDDIRVGPFDAAQFRPEESFDLISMSHVLEHLPDPIGAVRLTSELMSAGGVLQIVVPNRDYVAMRWSARSRGRIYDLPFHLHHFTRDSLAHVLSLADLNLIKVLPSTPRTLNRALDRLSSVRRSAGWPRGASTRGQEAAGTPGSDSIEPPGRSLGGHLVEAARSISPGNTLSARAHRSTRA
jgi:SAM-dependent methyltransferase